MLSVATGDGASFALTHLLCESLGPDPSPTLKEEAAFSIMVQLAPLDWHELQLGSSLSFEGAVPAGAVSVVDLEDRPRTRMAGRFDGLQLYVPHEALDALCRANGASVVGRLSRPRAEPDPTASALAALLLPHLHRTYPAGRLYVEHVTTAFLAHAVQSYGGLVLGTQPVRGGLSGWQERRAKELLRSSLDRSPSTEDLARECNMSARHFAAAFKASTGHPPHRYLTKLRLDHAKHLLVATDLPLVDIAMRCGFASQGHLTRVFARLTGCGPATWRRSNKG